MKTLEKMIQELIEARRQRDRQLKKVLKSISNLTQEPIKARKKEEKSMKVIGSIVSVVALMVWGFVVSLFVALKIWAGSWSRSSVLPN